MGLFGGSDVKVTKGDENCPTKVTVESEKKGGKTATAEACLNGKEILSVTTYDKAENASTIDKMRANIAANRTGQGALTTAKAEGVEVFVATDPKMVEALLGQKDLLKQLGKMNASFDPTADVSNPQSRVFASDLAKGTVVASR